MRAKPQASAGKRQFTKMKSNHEYFAVDGQDYVAMSQAQFDTCKPRDGVYLCNTNLLYVNNNKPSCLSNIYYRKPLADIVKYCEFIFYADLDPGPALINTDMAIVMANVAGPWTLNCAGSRVPIRHEGSNYAIVARDELCGCSLTAENTYIPAHSTGCNGDLDQINPKFVINSALAGIFKDMFLNKTLPNTARSYHRNEMPKFEPPKIVIKGYEEGKNLLDEGNSVSTNLKKLHAMMKKSREIYLNAEAKLAASNNFEYWFQEDNKSMIAVTMFSLAGAISSVIFLVMAIKYCKMNSVLSSMAWMASMTTNGTKASDTDDPHKNCDTSPNFKTMAVILGGQVVLIIALAAIMQLIREVNRRCCNSNRWAPLLNAAADSKAVCSVKMEFGNGFKIGTLDVCNVACHAANLSFTKSSNKVKVDKYFDNCVYDTIRVEWYSLGIKLHPMAEIVSLPQNVSVPITKRRRIKEIIECNHYIRVMCSTGGLIYATSGPSLKERSRFGLEPDCNARPNWSGKGETKLDFTMTNEEPKHSKRSTKVIIAADARITSNADNVMIIRNTPSLSRQAKLPDKDKLKTFHKVEQEVYHHPLLLPFRKDTTLL